jgi:hypothetical protein
MHKLLQQAAKTGMPIKESNLAKLCQNVHSIQPQNTGGLVWQLA